MGLTATERIHASWDRLTRTINLTRFRLTDSTEFVTETDVNFDTLYFEGDVGAIAGGFSGIDRRLICHLPLAWCHCCIRMVFGWKMPCWALPLRYQRGIAHRFCSGPTSMRPSLRSVIN